MKKRKILTIALTIALILSITVVVIPQSTEATDTTPDYSYSWELPSDGTNDTTNYYTVTRNNESDSATIEARAWMSNKTVKIDLNNIQSASLYLNETNIDTKDFQSLLDITGGSFKLILSSTVHEMNFHISGIPEFLSAELDSNQWNDYSYHSSNQTIDFSLTMSTHTLEFFYEGVFGELIAFLFVFIAIRFIFQKFRDLPTDGGDF